MCGRYALALRASQVRQMLLEDGMSVDEAPSDDGVDCPRHSYNFAPGYHGIVYRADSPGRGTVRHQANENYSSELDDDERISSEQNTSSTGEFRYKLQTMRWGLIPFWTKRNPDFAGMMRTINCRDDSLSSPGGMWATMKAKKRCIVIAQGFFEWLKIGTREKLPHYVKRKDGRLMYFAGLWDCVQYEGTEERNYTYTIITTDSSKQLRFLHDRMPVIFNPGSDEIQMWLNPNLCEWSQKLQSLLKPLDGKLEVYPVSKDVGKVGNNSPSFLIPLDSKENKSNIANFFANAQQKTKKQNDEVSQNPSEAPCATVKKSKVRSQAHAELEEREYADSPPTKKAKVEPKRISATHNERRGPPETKRQNSQKITRFLRKNN